MRDAASKVIAGHFTMAASLSLVHIVPVFATLFSWCFKLRTVVVLNPFCYIFPWVLMCMSPLWTALCDLLSVWFETFSLLWSEALPCDISHLMYLNVWKLFNHAYIYQFINFPSNLPCHWRDLSTFQTRQEYDLPKGWEHDIDDEDELPVSPELVRCHSNTMQDRICRKNTIATIYVTIWYIYIYMYHCITVRHVLTSRGLSPMRNP